MNTIQNNFFEFYIFLLGFLNMLLTSLILKSFFCFIFILASLLIWFLPFSSKIERDCNKQCPARLYARVTEIGIKMLEIFIKQVGCSQRQETVALGKPVPDGGIG